MNRYRLSRPLKNSRLLGLQCRCLLVWMGIALLLTTASSASTPGSSASGPASTPSTHSDPASTAAPRTPPPNAWLSGNAGDSMATVDPAAGGGDEPLLLEVIVNGHSTNKIGQFLLRHGVLLAKPDELRQLGFRVPVMLQKSDEIPLSALQGFLWSLDTKNQVLKVSVSEQELIPTLLQRSDAVATSNKPGAESRHRVIQSGTGLTFNYDEVGTYTSGQLGGSGITGFRAFSPVGVLSSSWLNFVGSTTYGSGSYNLVRLNSAYTYSDADSLRQYILGDFITDGLTWTRPITMEGVQLHSDFALRPDLITFPLPSLSGSAAVPSTVNVLANGNLVLSSQVGSGPFQTPQLPVINGAGNITMTMTNAMGQQVTVNQPFYTSSELLKPGLQQFSLQAGLPRRNWGTVFDAYGKMAGAALIRRGISPKLTLEASTESTVNEENLGGGGVYEIGSLGVVNADVAVTHGGGAWGSLYSLGAQHIGQIVSVGGQWIEATKNYRDVAAMNGEGVSRRQVSLFFSLASKRLGSVGAAYGDVRQNAPAVEIPNNVTAPLTNKIVSFNASKLWRKLNFYVQDFINISGEGSFNGLEGGVSISFGHRSNVEVGGTNDGIAYTQVQQSAPDIGDWGYDAYLSAGVGNNEFVQMQYKSPYGILLGGVDTGDGATTVQLEAQGAVSYVDKSLFPSNTIYDSFAIVDTNPLKNVQVYQENRNIGSTGKSGKLLVPDMRSYDANLISISPADVPLDVTLDNDRMTIRPQDRSGVVVKFPMKFSHGALVKIVGKDGNPIPVGSTVTLSATGVMFPVGYDGDVYMKNLGDNNEISVELDKGGRCTASFHYKPSPGQIPAIGPVTCMGDMQ